MVPAFGAFFNFFHYQSLHFLIQISQLIIIFNTNTLFVNFLRIYLYQSIPNGFSGNLIPDSIRPVDNSVAGYRKASSRP